MAEKFMLLKIFHEKFITYYINEIANGNSSQRTRDLDSPRRQPQLGRTQKVETKETSLPGRNTAGGKDGKQGAAGCV